jgi:hypothetical protein
MRDEIMLLAARNGEETQWKFDAMPRQSASAGRAIAGPRHSGVEAVRVIVNPIGLAI